MKKEESNSGVSGSDIIDLRSALSFLSTQPGQLMQTNEEVDPHAELAGVYKKIGAGGTVSRPTQTGPMMLFNNIKGYDDARVAIGVVGSRERVGLLLGTDPRYLGHKMNEALKNPLPPVMISKEKAVCQEVVHRATDPGFDIRKLIPAPTNTPEDAGPFITMGLVYGSDPETGEEDVTIHRQCLQSKDEISMYFVPGRHIGAFREKAEAQGKSLPISVSIGLDPAVYIAACFEPPATPIGYNELDIAGSLRNRPVEMVECLTVNAKAIANAEIVIEGELLPDRRVVEDMNTKTGRAMPEFPGYNGPANPSLPVFKIKAVTHRIHPITQTTIGPSEEHVNLAGIPTEASILTVVEKAMPGRVLNVYCHPAGGGKLLAVIQFRKIVPVDQGRERQAAICAFSAFPELKTVILVDEDVDIFDSKDVLWAMMTRYQSDVDTISIPGVRCHPLDPSQRPDISPSIITPGTSCKTIFDCTVRYDLKDRFKRAEFMEVDITRFLENSEMS
ncbi:UbiD family decarboxylase [Desulfosarcina ovata]|uniref:3,4-dihydroxybenzoate decarboxylase n=1 Tax=Desulfosarcina ovata subsp. ovata TaxID=2752305 RepID=A0A5K8AE50_9BACT|nr:UbiD family decarboxylase [Desulfosarcina ovata]BBO90857.1 3,4-dihydroxybenzoate decarboxylase [Desulfosarcina ovata subsp. ovata]